MGLTSDTYRSELSISFHSQASTSVQILRNGNTIGDGAPHVEQTTTFSFDFAPIRPKLGEYHDLEHSFDAFKGTQSISIHSQAYTSVGILPNGNSTGVLLHEEQTPTFLFAVPHLKAKTW